MLHINDITYRVGARVLLDHATVALQDGAKTGVVGRNGSGKTTLFRLITGEIAPETGAISLPRNARVGQVAQDRPADRRKVVRGRLPHWRAQYAASPGHDRRGRQD